MKNPVYTVAALALIVGSGLVHAPGPIGGERPRHSPSWLPDWNPCPRSSATGTRPRERSLRGSWQWPAPWDKSRESTQIPRRASRCRSCCSAACLAIFQPTRPTHVIRGPATRWATARGLSTDTVSRNELRSFRLRSPAGQGPNRPPCGFTGRGMGPAAGPRPRIHAGLSLSSRCSRSFTSCGKQAESRLIPKKILVLSSCLFCSPNSIA